MGHSRLYGQLLIGTPQLFQRLGGGCFKELELTVEGCLSSVPVDSFTLTENLHIDTPSFAATVFLRSPFSQLHY